MIEVCVAHVNQLTLAKSSVSVNSIMFVSLEELQFPALPSRFSQWRCTNTKSDCHTMKKTLSMNDNVDFFSLTGSSRNWFSFYSLYRSNDPLPCFSLLVSHVLLHVGKFGTWKYVWNHWRHHHTHCWYLQSQERNSFWWVAQTFFSHWSSKLKLNFFWEYEVLVFWHEGFQCWHRAVNHCIPDYSSMHINIWKPFPGCYKSRKIKLNFNGGFILQVSVWSFLLSSSRLLSIPACVTH